MFVMIEETRGVPNNCSLRVGGTDGSYARCRATKNWCIHRSPLGTDNEVEDVECPFDKHDVIQLEYRKQDG